MTYPTPPRTSTPARRGGASCALLVIGALVITTLSGCGARRPAPTTVQVVYEVSGTARSVNVTVRTGDGTEQASDLVVPLRAVYPMRRGDFAYLSARNSGRSGSVTCRISVGGVELATNTSTGGHTVTSCKGVVP